MSAKLDIDLITHVVMQEISSNLLLSIPQKVQQDWKMVRSGRPQIAAKSHNPVTYSADNGGIIIMSSEYVCTTKIDKRVGAIILCLLHQPAGTTISEQIAHKSYELSDPISIEKAVGFLFKAVSGYICPFKQI